MTIKTKENIYEIRKSMCWNGAYYNAYTINFTYSWKALYCWELSAYFTLGQYFHDATVIHSDKYVFVLR